ncbi:MarR family transcriptional regulator [Actinoplanes sp. NPDC026619]|uniref:MarR family winged helix-turn-helix transcriptional regulator n=1 Tax=Actinoplanes sp. NPDC026619 TaxID=3155798 RepID=UPI00340066F9
MPNARGEVLIYDAVEAIYNVVEATDALVTDVLDELDLTKPLADVVWVMHPDGPALTMGMLAAKLRCEPSTATFLVERLVEKGLVQRGTDTRDRRRTTVSLTAAGMEARERQTTAMTTVSPLARLTPEELGTLVGLLGKALDGLLPKYRM